MAPKGNGPEKQWVLATEQPQSIANTNYEKYAHPIAMPGPVLSAKTGKQYTPQLSELGKKKKGAAPKRQASQGNYGAKGAAAMGGGLDLMIQSQPQQINQR